MATKKHSFTQDELAAAFTEWMRRYKEDPERFWNHATTLLKVGSSTYGEACAPYFLEILAELKEKTDA